MKRTAPPDPLNLYRTAIERAHRRLLRLLRAIPASRRYEAPERIGRELARLEPALLEPLRAAQLQGFLTTAVETAKPLRLKPVGDLPPEPPEGYFPASTSREERPVRFPAVERSARWLATRLDYTPDEFRELDNQARETAFTVARATTLDAVQKVREAVAEDVRSGGTLNEFRAVVDEALGASALSPSQSEALYRTHVARAQAAGQQDVLDHPAIEDEFPFVLYTAVHDSRVDVEHLAMESLGIDGTAVYYKDDPVIRRFWPPWRWNCRCAVIPLSIEDAALRGVKEAQQWIRTGRPPAARTYVAEPPFSLPKGWVPVHRGLTAAL